MRQSVVMMALSVLLCGMAWGQAKNAEPELPLAAKSAVQELERTIQLAKKKAVEKLKSAMRAEMQSGNLVRANLINQEILRITETANSGAMDSIESLVIGEWKRKDGIAYVFHKNNEVHVQNEWSGTWEQKNKNILIVLDRLSGKPAHRMEYLYEIPEKKDVGGDVLLVMQAPPGCEDQTLYRKQ